MALSRQQIRDAATELAINAGVHDQFPVPLERIAEYLDYQCLQFLPDDTTNKISGAVNHQQRKIYVNGDDPARRQMFTLAHEIGHVALHGEVEGNFIDHRSPGPKTPKELEADMFASELLMPEFHFRSSWSEWDGVPSLIATVYGVSEQAVKVRAKILKLR
ncbi:ImmA/IrrE family metallo-endopeptidase [Parendozoicomonas sp. Alg238-R29]|uniref:ImmA/IrrE family metallo-endopeptidase n=1 Tax=Parendozoicomonas sp. Alg238-R29 TaxID=2993446 RepID=UPI00248E8DB6|nr:ImmA/IrrE family metallo-endopeptidase [Parendozoicomonas sp. Alg238-R29]